MNRMKTEYYDWNVFDLFVTLTLTFHLSEDRELKSEPTLSILWPPANV